MEADSVETAAARVGRKRKATDKQGKGAPQKRAKKSASAAQNKGRIPPTDFQQTDDMDVDVDNAAATNTPAGILQKSIQDRWNAIKEQHSAVNDMRYAYISQVEHLNKGVRGVENDLLELAAVINERDAAALAAKGEQEAEFNDESEVAEEEQDEEMEADDEKPEETAEELEGEAAVVVDELEYVTP